MTSLTPASVELCPPRLLGDKKTVRKVMTSEEGWRLSLQADHQAEAGMQKGVKHCF